MPVFLNQSARAWLLISYLKVAIKPGLVVERYVPRLKDLSARITAGVCELRAAKRDNPRRDVGVVTAATAPRP